MSAPALVQQHYDDGKQVLAYEGLHYEPPPQQQQSVTPSPNPTYLHTHTTSGNTAMAAGLRDAHSPVETVQATHSPPPASQGTAPKPTAYNNGTTPYQVMAAAHGSVPMHHYPTEKMPLQPDGEQRRTIMGLRPATFFLSLALVLVIIIAAVGGGVGGTMAVKNARDQALLEAQGAAAAQGGSAAPAGSASHTVTVTVQASATTTSTSGTSSPSSTQSSNSDKIRVPFTGMLDFDCAAEKADRTITLGNQQWRFNRVCATDFNGDAVDIMAIISYDYAQCLQACASYNRNLKRDACIAVAFTADLGTMDIHYGNCWLKNSTGQRNRSGGNERIGAMLVKP